MEPFLAQSYDSMWIDSIDHVRMGEIEIDPVLAAGQPDGRRGMTLVLRPSAEVQRRVGEFLDELRGIEPDAYFYHPSELHVTFLSLFTATANHGAFTARAADYIEAVRVIALRVAPVRIEFRGVTLSSGAVMMQGFTDAAVLNAARDELRRELIARDLAQSLDSRYRLQTAHMTALRFRAPLRDAAVFCERLERARSRDFGESLISETEVTYNDWYMSRNGTDVQARVSLGTD